MKQSNASDFLYKAYRKETVPKLEQVAATTCSLVQPSVSRLSEMSFKLSRKSLAIQDKMQNAKE